MTDLPPLSLYIHIPWCVRKCPYCDFNSHEAERIPQGQYVKALIKDMDTDAELAQKRPLQSIFFGGGTPSLFSAAAIDAILRHAEQTFGFADGIEITLETNPGTAEFDHLDGYRSAGVNRLSFGMQSFHNSLLEALGRIHSAEEAMAAFKMAREAGFNNINIDLMHGLPKQSLQQALIDLERACQLEPEHISWYQLTIEPNTRFYSQRPSLPNTHILEDIQDQGLALLDQRGYRQYEISAFAKGDRQSKHNLNYWQFGDYLGVGAGAHSKITLPSGLIQRGQKTRAPKDYLLNPSHSKISAIETSDLALEFMMNALRLVDGVPKSYFEHRTGRSLDTQKQTLIQLTELGLLVESDILIQASERGRNFLNDTLAYF